jgi:hypothetical protein
MLINSKKKMKKFCITKKFSIFATNFKNNFNLNIMKKVLIFTVIALVALATTGCGASAFLSAQRDVRELKGYKPELGQFGSKQSILENAYQRAKNEDKILVIGRADKCHSVDIAKSRASADARWSFVKEYNSNVIGEEKLTMTDYTSKFQSTSITEANAHVNNDNFERVATFIKHKGNNASAIVFYLGSKR